MNAIPDLADNVRAHLRAAGWTDGSPGSGGALWRLEQDAMGTEAVIAVPNVLDENAVEWRGIVERLARHEGRQPEDVRRQILGYWMDITRFRAASESIRGSIPLGAGVDLVKQAHAMLRAAASTAQRPRGHIAGGFSKTGDEIAARARMGHTEEGSYIVPLLMPLPMPSPDAEEPLPLQESGVERIAYEPAERRVTRTLAQALATVQQHVIEPSREPRAKDMAGLIHAGVSRELVVALERVVNNPDVSTFEAAFVFGGAVGAPLTLPSRVSLPDEAAPLLAKTAQLLKTSRREPAQVVSGPIVEVRHLPDEPFGEISVQVVRNGRPAEVRVTVRDGEMSRLHAWMDAHRYVLVDGDIERVPGQPLRIRLPKSIHPLDETRLQTD